jgi:hypothetical protein
MEVKLVAFLTSTLDGNEWLDSCSDCFISLESPQYPSDRRLSGPESRCGRSGEDKNLLPLSGIELMSFCYCTNLAPNLRGWEDIFKMYLSVRGYERMDLNLFDWRYDPMMGFNGHSNNP